MNTALIVRRLIKKELFILVIVSVYLLGQLALNLKFVLLNYFDIGHLAKAFNGFLTASFSLLIVIAMCIYHIKYWIFHHRFRKFVKTNIEELTLVVKSNEYIEKTRRINKHLQKHVFALLLSHFLYMFIMM